MTLKELQIGDWFYPKSKQFKNTHIFTVVENCKFNAGHGSSTRICRDNVTNEPVSKSCRLEVIKVNHKPKPTAP